jgi:uncharacterized protein YeaO (DUF488 family)
MTGSFNTKRMYAPPSHEDGFRVLVDRLWPRGMKRETAKIDLWAKEIAPSLALRREFHGHPERWDKFVAAYRKELSRASRQHPLPAISSPAVRSAQSRCSTPRATRSTTMRSR